MTSSIKVTLHNYLKIVFSFAFHNYILKLSYSIVDGSQKRCSQLHTSLHKLHKTELLRNRLKRFYISKSLEPSYQIIILLISIIFLVLPLKPFVL